MRLFSILLGIAFSSYFFYSTGMEGDAAVTTRKLSYDEQMGIILTQKFLAQPVKQKVHLPSWLSKKNFNRTAIILSFLWLAYDFFTLYDQLYIQRARQTTGWWSSIVPWLPFVTMERHLEFFCRSLTPIARTALLLGIIKMIKFTLILV